MADFDNELRGVIFPNDKRSSDKSPNATGHVQVKGVVYRLAGWTKTSNATGKRFMPIKLTPPDDGVDQTGEAPRQQEQTLSEDIPF